MSGPGDEDDDKAGKGKPAGAWPPDAEYAEPTGAPDTYDPGYVPPPANPAADNTHAAEGPPAELYPTAGTYPWSEKPPARPSKTAPTDKASAPSKSAPPSKSAAPSKDAAPRKPSKAATPSKGVVANPPAVAVPPSRGVTPPTLVESPSKGAAPSQPPTGAAPPPQRNVAAPSPAAPPTHVVPSADPSNLAPQNFAAPPGAVTPPSTAAGDLPAESGDATASDWLARQGDYAAGGEWTPPPSDAPPPGDWQMPQPSPGAPEEPLLPPELAADGALNDAIGAPSAKARRRARTQPRHDDGDDDDGLAPPRNRRTMIIATASIVVGLGIATLVFLGRANAQRYVLSCDSAHAVAEQGRGFPPWGSRPMHGPEWAPIALPANAECQPRETDDINELGKWYLELLLDRANVTLTARDLLDSVGSQSTANPLDLVGAQLDQALLLARDPDRRDQRKDITRLQGDVAYWRAAARLRDATTVLVDAAKQFDTANQQHPRHATDAAAWSTFLHHLADELHAGPNGAVPIAPSTATNAAVTRTTPVPVGTALPVEPDSGSDGSAVAPPTPDAGIPSGGVLL